MKPRPRNLAANEANNDAQLRMVGAANDVIAIAPITEEVGHADNWFQVSPFGSLSALEVGLQIFDQQAANSIVKRCSRAPRTVWPDSSWRGLPVFVGHPDLDPKTYPTTSKYGSIQDLEVRADGLWAKPKWSPAGREIVNERALRFSEPALEHGADPERARQLSPRGTDFRGADQPPEHPR